MRIVNRAAGLLLAASLVLMQGCAVGPDYAEPEIAPPDAWHSAVAEEMSQPEPDISTWWDTLGDTVLTDLIRRAELANLDLKTAVARVREARAARGIAKGDFFPQITLDGTYSYFKLSENSLQGQAVQEAGGTVEPQEEWDVSLGAFWEIDLFGRIRRQNEAARAAFEASIEDFRDVLVSLFAEVAAGYVDVRTFEARLDFARRNAEAQRQTVRLTTDRFNAGLVSALDVSQARTNLASTEAEIPSLETSLNSALNRLAVLLGAPPGTLHAELSGGGAIPTAPDSVAVGLPAELLRRRPDVRRAERQLASQTALIGVAKADLYPSFSLGGVLSLVAGVFGDLGQSESVSWGLVPGVRWNLFSGGKIRSNIGVQEARTEQLLLQYEQAVLLALEEVESALVAYEKEKTRRDRLAEAVTAAERSVEIVRTQYLSGLVDFQRYVDSERALAAQQDLLAASEGRVVQNLIVLNRALGGGWRVEPSAPDQAAQAAATETGATTASENPNN
ncbi:MAG: efflux transporter outer membrane subunit [Gemmatimonadota bacterium]|nr:MAG: efflux transporter outer membrane subunit [Gemmatimonadota bacterium]